MTNTLKYFSFIQQFDNCPPPHCTEINVHAFRYIFEDRNHPVNFKPVLLIKPSRINDKLFDTDEQKCSGYALSLYDLLPNARSGFIILYNRYKNIANNIGSHVAEISVESHEGVATEPSSKESNLGHFDFFEYVNTNFYNKIINIEKLIP